MVAVHWWQRGGRGQRGGGVGSAAAAAGRRQGSDSGGGGSTPMAAGLEAAVVVWRHRGVSGSSRAPGAVLPPQATTVAMKTPAATVMVRAQTTINNQLKAVAATAAAMATRMTIKM